MRAIVQESEYGHPKDVCVLREDYPTPELDPKKSEVLVKVKAFSINPIDYKVIQGFLKAVMPTKFPFVPGSDLSGEVVRTSDGYKGDLKPGDRVWADNIRLGAMAEYARVPETKCHSMPKNLSFEQAAAIPLAGLTSYQALKKAGELTPGQKVVVLGGSGGTGHFALQIAKELGASHVATTSSSLELCKCCGADQVINYRKGEKFGDVLAGGDFDLVFDCVGGIESYTEANRVLKSGGKFVTIVGDSTAPLTCTGVCWMGLTKLWRNMCGRGKYMTVLTDSDTKADYNFLRDLCESKKLKPVLDPIGPFRLDGWKTAFGQLMNGHAKGKIVVRIGQDRC